MDGSRVYIVSFERPQLLEHYIIGVYPTKLLAEQVFRKNAIDDLKEEFLMKEKLSDEEIEDKIKEAVRKWQAKLNQEMSEWVLEVCELASYYTITRIEFNVNRIIKKRKKCDYDD